MSLFLAGALKAHLESLGLGVAAYRGPAPKRADNDPARTPIRYITIDEGVSRTPNPAFNPAADEDGHITELVRVHCWQLRTHPVTGALVEDPAFVDTVMLSLHGLRLTDLPFAVDGVRVVGGPRIPDPDPNVIHDVITVSVARTLARSAP